MGLDGDKKKLVRATTNLSSLRDDLSRVMTPNLRTFILSQIAQRENQINLLMGKINMYGAIQPRVTQPLPEKKTPAPKVTAVVKKKKALDKQNPSPLK
jgi:hypothetical protein